MESLTSSTIVMIYQMVNKEMRTEITKVRCESVRSGSEMSVNCSLITACPNRELRREDNWYFSRVFNYKILICTL